MYNRNSHVQYRHAHCIFRFRSVCKKPRARRVVWSLLVCSCTSYILRYVIIMVYCRVRTVRLQFDITLATIVPASHYGWLNFCCSINFHIPAWSCNWTTGALRFRRLIIMNRNICIDRRKFSYFTSYYFVAQFPWMFDSHFYKNWNWKICAARI